MRRNLTNTAEEQREREMVLPWPDWTKRSFRHANSKINYKMYITNHPLVGFPSNYLFLCKFKICTEWKYLICTNKFTLRLDRCSFWKLKCAGNRWRSLYTYTMMCFDHFDTQEVLYWEVDRFCPVNPRMEPKIAQNMAYRGCLCEPSVLILC